MSQNRKDNHVDAHDTGHAELPPKLQRMTISRLIATLAQECPNGVSFEPMALRLLRKKVQFPDGQIEKLKGEMFQLENGLWFSSEMVEDDKIRRAIRNKAMAWLEEYGCFSVEQLYSSFSIVLKSLNTLGNFTAFLQHLGFIVPKWEKIGFFCCQSPSSLNERLATVSKEISNQLEGAHGTLAFSEIVASFPHLTTATLEEALIQFLPDVYATEIGGVNCWCSSESICLPEDFSEKLTAAVDTLIDLGERITAKKLEFALNLFYRVHFRKEYALLDDDVFMEICVKHYQGDNNVFRSHKKKSCTRTNDQSETGKRARSPNTRFSRLGVPIGAELVFIKDNDIKCTVLDGHNQVEYKGKPWAISALVMNLLNWSAANGFSYFSYEGEILWDRRMRLEREGEEDEHPAEKMSPSTTAVAEENEIIGLEGRPLSPATWRNFCADGSNPDVAVWAHRVEKGETVDQISKESGYAVPTIRVMISNFHLYHKVCKLNGIKPARNTNV